MFHFVFMFLVIALARTQSTVTGVPNSNNNASKNPKVKVDLYYETLCPDSIKFHTTQLEPTMKKLGSYIDLHTYPFGKAKMHEEGGTTTFTCQHGEKECYGNKLHACAIEKLGIERALEYNVCMILKKSNDEAADECATQLKQYSINSDVIKTCAKGVEGDHLLKRAGDETAKVLNILKHVPCVVINNKKLGSSSDSPDTPASLMHAVCNILEYKPAECKEEKVAGKH